MVANFNMHEGEPSKKLFSDIDTQPLFGIGKFYTHTHTCIVCVSKQQQKTVSNFKVRMLVIPVECTPSNIRRLYYMYIYTYCTHRETIVCCGQLKLPHYAGRITARESL